MLYVAMGCFWGAERIFWQAARRRDHRRRLLGGFTPNPTYEEVCAGRTGHTEAVLVVYDPARHLVRDPAHGVLGEPRPDPGACARATTSARQYRSAIYWTTDRAA